MKTNLQTQLITAAFMMEGIGDLQYTAALEKLQTGSFDFVDEILSYVPFLTHLAETVSAVNGDNYPGVFDYDVSSSFGCWFAVQCANNGSPPSRDDVRAYLAGVVEEFFSQGCSDVEKLTIKAALSGAFVYKFMEELHA
jgi:hypothetical protein